MLNNMYMLKFFKGAFVWMVPILAMFYWGVEEGYHGSYFEYIKITWTEWWEE